MMNSIELKISTEQVLSLARQLPREMKLQLVQEWLAELKTAPSELVVDDFDEPFQLDEAKIRLEQLEALRKLWEDEPSAEELSKMLTK